MQKTVLVTGAAGALGQAVVSRLRRTEQNHVVGVDCCSHDPDLVQLDIRNHEQLASLIRDTRPNLILHLAATFTDQYDQACAVNLEATRQLLEIVQQQHIRVLLVGSAAEYGVVQPEENPVREDRVLKPVSIYGLTKAWQTQLAGLYAMRGVDVVVARIFNLEGAGLSERLFIGRLLKQIDELQAGHRTTIELGPLSATRDYLPLDQAARQLLAIAAHGAAGEVYHVASGIPVTMRTIMQRIIRHHGLDPALVHEAAELSNRGGYDVPVIYADMTKTRQLLEQWSGDADA